MITNIVTHSCKCRLDRSVICSACCDKSCLDRARLNTMHHSSVLERANSAVGGPVVPMSSGEKGPVVPMPSGNVPHSSSRRRAKAWEDRRNGDLKEAMEIALELHSLKKPTKTVQPTVATVNPDVDTSTLTETEPIPVEGGASDSTQEWGEYWVISDDTQFPGL